MPRCTRFSLLFQVLGAWLQTLEHDSSGQPPMMLAKSHPDAFTIAASAHDTDHSGDVLVVKRVSFELSVGCPTLAPSLSS